MSSPEFNLSELDEMYREIILDHYRRPHNSQPLAEYSVIADGINPFCGDESHIQIALDGNGRVAQVGVQGRGCSISQSSGSLMSDLLKGKSVLEMEELVGFFRQMMQDKSIPKEAREKLQDADILEGVRRFPIRIKCAMLAWVTLLDGLDAYKAQGSGSDA